MLTRDQIEEIQSESREKGLSIKKLLEEKGIPAHQYFWWMPPSVMSGIPTCGAPRGKPKAAPAAENWMSIELRTVAGTDMRIQGGLTPAMVYTILKSL